MRWFFCLIGLTFLFSCARQGSPSGGPKDILPPKFIKSFPDTLSVNVSTNLKEIRIDFNEYLVLKGYNKQVVVSPPLSVGTVFSPVGFPKKYIQIKLDEPLQENTTYNINFGKAIQDNNEGNTLHNYNYVFSTGSYIDSLSIKGAATVLGEKKMSEDIVVALYKRDSTYNDSIILKQKPYYVSRLDSIGSFNLNYLREGKYQLIAFEDKVPNMQFDLGLERFGFLDQEINLKENQSYNIQLYEQKPNYKVDRAEQKNYGHIVFRFKGSPSAVNITPLNKTFTTAKVNHSTGSDSLNFWFDPSIDTIEEKNFRLKFLLKHKDFSDTVSLVYSNSKLHNLKFKESNEDSYTPIKGLKLLASYPIAKINPERIKVLKDSITLPFTAIKNPDNDNEIDFDFALELNQSYKVEVLPNAFIDIFNETNDSLQLNLTTPKKEELGNLRLTLQNKPKHPFWLQLFNGKDEMLREVYTSDSSFEYLYLRPGDYYFKILVDENENKDWDTGDFFNKKQPEPILVYPKNFSVRALWDVEETWVLPEEIE